jgi:hypothetical protein
MAEPSTDKREPNGGFHSCENFPVPARLSKKNIRGTMQLGEGVSGLMARISPRDACSTYLWIRQEKGAHTYSAMLICSRIEQDESFQIGPWHR